MDEDVRTLRRLRANPDKIRVSIREVEEFAEPAWTATVTERKSGRFVMFTSALRAEFAVMAALERAQAMGFDGIDLGCQWTYSSWPEPEQQEPEEQDK